MLIVNSGKCGDNLTWTYDENQKLLDIDGSGPMLFDSIPWEEWKDEVETVFLHECSFICAGAFRGFKKLRDVTVFEEELKEIGPSAFEDCVSLKSIYFFGRAELQKVSDCAFRNCTCLKSWDANVAVVGSRAFENCINLDFRGYAVGTEEIGAYAFANCKSMSQLPMYDGNQGWFYPWYLESQPGHELTVIPEGAFLGCDSLENVNIPYLVKEVQSNAFAQCKNLTEIMITDKTNYAPSSFQKEPLVVEGFASCGDHFRVGGEVRWILKQGVLRFAGNGAVSSGPENYDMDYCDSPPWDWMSVHTVIIEEGCKIIDSCTFHNHINLKTVVIPTSVETIGAYAFWGCHQLDTLVIPDSVQTIGPRAFCKVPHIIYCGPEQYGLGDSNWGALRRN